MIPRARLETILKRHPKDAQPPAHSTKGISTRSASESPDALLAFLKSCDIDVKHVRKKESGATVLVLSACPMNPDHGHGTDTAIVWRPTGIGFACKHSSCADYKWRDVLTKIEGGTSTARSRFFRADGKFVAAALADAVKDRFEPIRYVRGTYYSYDPEGVWREVARDELGRHARQLLGTSARAFYINDSLQLLQFDVAINDTAFQSTPGLVNLRNGMLDIRRRRLKSHRARYNSRSQLPFDYDPEATCPRWRQFLKSVFRDEPDKARTLQQWFGYCLIPDVFLQQFLLLIGSGANGKSVVLSVLGELVGAANRSAIPLDRMDRDFVLVELKDKLVNLTGEIDTSRPLKASIMKTLTGEDAITVDKKYCDPVTFRPTAKHVFAVNEIPHFSDRSYAMRRRAIFLEFSQKFVGDDRDPAIAQKLLAELPGILNWAIVGLCDLLESRAIYRSRSTRRCDARFAESLNPVLAFVRERCCRKDACALTKKTKLYAAYLTWHLLSVGTHPLARATFYERMRSDFPIARMVKLQGVQFFRGIRIIPKGEKGEGDS